MVNDEYNKVNNNDLKIFLIFHRNTQGTLKFA
jgi:hypothetical protein